MAGTMAELARRIIFPLRFAAHRVIAARRPMSVAAFGVALAACALAVAFAASAIVENRAVADAVDQLPANARDVEVTWVGVGSAPSERPDELDRQARAALNAECENAGVPRRSFGGTGCPVGSRRQPPEVARRRAWPASPSVRPIALRNGSRR
jgi:hypothetical protein